MIALRNSSQKMVFVIIAALPDPYCQKVELYSLWQANVGEVYADTKQS